MPAFRATIALLGINPYVSVPARHLKALFAAAGREQSPIPIRVTFGLFGFEQNLVKYQGEWRLYLNQAMRDAAGKDVGERISLSVEYDPVPRREPMHPSVQRALAAAPEAKRAFLALPPSRQKEILRYLNQAKTDATRERNVGKAVRLLLGDADDSGTLAAFRRPVKRARKTE